MTSTGLQGGIGAGLVSSGADAKDGAHALKLGYGTIAAHDHVTKGTNAQQYKDLPNVSIPEAVREEREDLNRSASTRKSKSHSSSGTGSIRSTDSKSVEFIYHHRGPTRSGSITEQIVDVNGIRKVVLHANCSSSSEGETGENGASARLTGISSPVTKDSVTNTTNTTDLQTSAHEPQTKKRRRKKKHGKHHNPPGGDGAREDQPLLH
jgi:metal transporter CNNM